MRRRGIIANDGDITDELFEEISKFFARCLYCGYWIDVDEIDKETSYCDECLEKKRKK